MKRILLPILVIGILLLGACGAPAEAPATPTTYTLSVSVSPSGAGSVSPSGGKYEEGTEVTLTATPAEDYIFIHWGGDVTGNTNPIAVTMTGDKSFVACFAKIIYERSEAFSVTTVIQGHPYILGASHRQVWSVANKFLTDFALEVEVAKAEGPDDEGCYGVIFLLDDLEFVITGDGQYALRSRSSPSSEPVYIVPFTPSLHINTGNATNKLKVVCNGSTIKLYINEYLLNEVDGQFENIYGTGSYLGCIVEYPLSVVFYHMKMWSPSGD